MISSRILRATEDAPTTTEASRVKAVGDGRVSRPPLDARRSRVERRHQGGSGFVPRAWLLLEEPHHDRLEPRRHQGRGIGLRDWRNWCHHVPYGDVGRLALERRLAREHLVHDNAERIEIGTLVNMRVTRLFGSDICRRPDDVPALRDARLIARGKRGDCEPEVEDTRAWASANA